MRRLLGFIPLASLMLFSPASTASAGSRIVHPMNSRAAIGSAGTVVLRGSLASTVTMTMSGALSVGRAQDLSWELPRVPTVHLVGFSQDVLTQSYQFSVAPDSFQDLKVGGEQVRRFYWANPPANTVIRVTQSLIVRTHSDLAPFVSTTAYPLPSTPALVSPYLGTTGSLHLPANLPLLRQFRRGQRTEAGVVRAVADWVASNVKYDGSVGGSAFKATWVLQNRRATCQGYASLEAALLHALGIPARVVFGWVDSKPIFIPTMYGHTSLEWGGAGANLHDWLNVYFPGQGWVPFDPQLEKFFIDARHVALLTEKSAAGPTMGSWSFGTDEANGRPLAGGYPEIVPGDGTWPVRVRVQDSFRPRVASVVRDVTNVTLFSR